jgi:hypothetical protein
MRTYTKQEMKLQLKQVAGEVAVSSCGLSFLGWEVICGVHIDRFNFLSRKSS